MRLQLSIRATLTNLTALRFPETYTYHFRVKCTSCNELHGSEVTLTPGEEREISGSRGKGEFVWKCGFCERESWASFEPKSGKEYTADEAEAGKWKSVAVFECRGLEFTEFVPTVGCYPRRSGLDEDGRGLIFRVVPGPVDSEIHRLLHSFRRS